MININRLHKMLGHPSKAKTKVMAEMLGITLVDKLHNCNNCEMGKARQKI